MSREIRHREKIVFIASENSIKSKACQYELTEVRKRYNNNWSDDLVAIRLDDYFLDVEEYDLENHPNKDEYWTNIVRLRSGNVKSYVRFAAGNPTHEFELEVDKLILESLRRRSQKQQRSAR